MLKMQKNAKKCKAIKENPQKMLNDPKTRKIEEKQECKIFHRGAFLSLFVAICLHI